ncbi:MAG: protein translocase subunit SecF [Gemmatimonadota bacterium]
MFWIFRNASYTFLQWRKKAYWVSGVVLALGVAAMVFNVFAMGSTVNYGVDFTGGTRVLVAVGEGTTEADLREALGGTQAPSITRFGAENEFQIRTPVEEGVSVDAVGQAIQAQLTESPLITDYEVLALESVGAVIGEELTRAAALAILISFVLTLLYLAIRFELRFGLASVIATVHDILITIGFLALFRVEISLPTVAAVLTVIGYSLNDTIVVFDRIRENLQKKGGRRENPIDLINRSINESLPRTLMTSGTTLAVLISLLVLGGTVIRDFTIVLILGVVIGTYSSIFVASPALLEIQNRFGTKEEADRKQKLRSRKKKKETAIPV